MLARSLQQHVRLNCSKAHVPENRMPVPPSQRLLLPTFFPSLPFSLLFSYFSLHLLSRRIRINARRARTNFVRTNYSEGRDSRKILLERHFFRVFAPFVCVSTKFSQKLAYQLSSNLTNLLSVTGEILFRACLVIVPAILSCNRNATGLWLYRIIRVGSLLLVEICPRNFCFVFKARSPQVREEKKLTKFKSTWFIILECDIFIIMIII